MAFTGDTQMIKCCKPSHQQPNPVHNLILFEVSGFRYQYMPIWIDSNGKRMIPLQLNETFNNCKLAYTWKFYKDVNKPLCDMFWFLKTSDDIVPVVIEKITGTFMTVQRKEKCDGVTTWEITC